MYVSETYRTTMHLGQVNKKICGIRSHALKLSFSLLISPASFSISACQPTRLPLSQCKTIRLFPNHKYLDCVSKCDRVRYFCCDAHSTAASHEKFRNHRPTGRNRRPSAEFSPFIRQNKKTLLGKKPSSVTLLAGEEGFEPSAYGFGDRRSTN